FGGRRRRAVGALLGRRDEDDARRLLAAGANVERALHGRVAGLRHHQLSLPGLDADPEIQRSIVDPLAVDGDLAAARIGVETPPAHVLKGLGELLSEPALDLPAALAR